MSETLFIRVHGNPTLPCLVHIPGIHGDWTLIQGFRAALSSRVCFVEITYPRTLEWTLDDYAEAILRALHQAGISSAWLIGESFGSQPVWSIMSRRDRSLRVEGIILAGGFVKYPAPGLLNIVKWFFARIRAKSLSGFWGLYRLYSGFRFRQNKAALQAVDEFVARRTELDMQAISHRMNLISANDPRSIVRETREPVYALTGLVDPVVPAWPVVVWLKRFCPGFTGSKVILSADHNVLGTAPEASVEMVLEWMEFNPATGGQNLPR